MKTFKEIYSKIQEQSQPLDKIVEYANKNNVPVHNVYRPHSDAYYELTKELSESIDKYPQVDELTKRLFIETDLGQWSEYEGERIPLDMPLVEAEYNGREVELNSPKRGGSKKFYVYVKNNKGNVIKVEFGDTSGLKAKINDRSAAKNFASRHRCDTKNDRTKPGYWSCRLPMYAKELGFEGGGDYFW